VLVPDPYRAVDPGDHDVAATEPADGHRWDEARVTNDGIPDRVAVLVPDTHRVVAGRDNDVTIAEPADDYLLEQCDQ